MVKVEGEDIGQGETFGRKGAEDRGLMFYQQCTPSRTKKCRGPCALVKPVEAFNKDKSKADELQSCCKDCTNERRAFIFVVCRKVVLFMV